MPGHAEDGTAPDLLGYGVCADCRTPVRLEVLHATRDRCQACFLADREAGGKVVSIRRNGGRFDMRLEESVNAEKHRRREARRRDNPDRRYRKARNGKAALRAMKRLKQAFPELYEVYLAEERARDGLEPFPTSTVLKTAGAAAAQQSDDFAAVYHALTQEGITL